MEDLIKKLKEFGEVKRGVQMSRFTTFRIGGKVMALVIISETKKLTGLLDFLRAEGVDYYILGGGSNLLWTDEDFDGVVVKINNRKVKIDNERIEAEAGMPLGQLVNLAAQNGLSGLEWAIGIPGTVGGAVRGNAGAMGEDMSKSVAKAEVWRDGEIVIVSNEECGFGYRDSSIKNSQDVILRVFLKLDPGEKVEIMGRMQKNLAGRAGKFPPHPSAGSFFKNIKLDKWPGDKSQLPPLFLERGTVPAGWVIEQCGLLGKKIGEAEVSSQHGNFVVNLEKAAAADVLKLVEEVTEAVYNKFKVELEPEVQIYK